MRRTIGLLLLGLALALPAHAGEKPRLCLTAPPPDPQTSPTTTLPGGDAKTISPVTAQELADLRQSFGQRFSVTAACSSETSRVVVRGKGFLVAPGFYFGYNLDVQAAGTSPAASEALTCSGDNKGKECVKKVEDWLRLQGQPK